MGDATTELVRTMRFRKLRIAWSVECCLLCLLLIALWVRSYRTEDTIAIRDRGSGYYTYLGSNSGTMFFHRSAIEIFFSPSRRPTPRWNYYARNASEPQAVFVWNSKISPLPIGISFPYWLPVVLAALATAVPWLSRCKRFSLRTLLIAITTIGLMHGIIIATTR
jgi:hypothetical protein